MRRLKKAVALLLITTILSGLLSGCGTKLVNTIDERATRFADGKPVEKYTLEGVDVRLKFLMDSYSGSFYEPTFREDGSEQAPPSDTAAGPFEVGNYEELVNAFRQVYAATEEQAKIILTNGYTVNLKKAMMPVYRTIRREDPLHASGVYQWSPPYERDGIYIINIHYYCNANSLIRKQQDTRDEVAKIAEKIRASADTDYERICEVNRYLCETVTYLNEKKVPQEAHTAYGALKKQSAVCDGYATAAMLILKELGIDCDLQVGLTFGFQKHAWNLVYLDGEWYQMDITWNDLEEECKTKYLLVTDGYMYLSRWWKYGAYPKTALEPYKE